MDQVDPYPGTRPPAVNMGMGRRLPASHRRLRFVDADSMTVFWI